MLRISRLLLFCVLLPGSATRVMAADDAARQAIGFSAGFVTGTGITYRRYIKESFVQGTFFGRYEAEGRDTMLISGVSWGHYLHRIETSRALPPVALTFITGIHASYNSFGYTRYVEGPTPMTGTTQSFDSRSYTGAGLAIEIGNPGQRGLDLWLAITYAASFYGIFQDLEAVEPLPAIGILYNW